MPLSWGSRPAQNTRRGTRGSRRGSSACTENEGERGGLWTNVHRPLATTIALSVARRSARRGKRPRSHRSALARTSGRRYFRWVAQSKAKTTRVTDAKVADEADPRFEPVAKAFARTPGFSL